ncbi:hypothetical protein B5F41_03945 [Gordonibacter sp. An232A]|nr:hypothetical protein B5F41_03945 [Gordonibacter sp. An232A]
MHRDLAKRAQESLCNHLRVIVHAGLDPRGEHSCFAPSLLRLLKPALKPLLVNTLSHNFFEFNNLASILPEVYAQEKDAW